MSFSNGFSFSNLNLTGVKAAQAAVVLAPGKYVVKTSKAELTDTRSGGKQIVVRCEDIKGKGVITARINVHLPNASPKAVEIGLEQLKALAVHGGHPDPDNIGDHGVSSLSGLNVGIVVGSEMYEGERRSKVNSFIPASEVPGYEDTEAAKGGGSSDDDIPFANPYRGRAAYVV